MRLMCSWPAVWVGVWQHRNPLQRAPITSALPNPGSVYIIGSKSLVPPRVFPTPNFVDFRATLDKLHPVSPRADSVLYFETESDVPPGLELDSLSIPTKKAWIPPETGEMSFLQMRMYRHRGRRSARRRCPPCPSASRRSCRTGDRSMRWTGKREMALWLKTRRKDRTTFPQTLYLSNPNHQNKGTVRLGYVDPYRCPHHPVSAPGFVWNNLSRQIYSKYWFM